MNKLEAVIEEFINKKQPEEVVMPDWDIQILENSSLSSLDIVFCVKNELRFQYKYQNVLDICGSGISFKEKNGRECSISFMVNIFVDLMNGGVKDFKLSPDMHGLVLLKKNKDHESNGLIQIFDQANEKCLFTKKVEGYARLL